MLKFHLGDLQPTRQPSRTLKMKPSRLLLTVTTLALTLLFTFAVPTATAAAAKPAAPPVPVDTRKMIKSVDAAAGTIVIQYMRDKTIHAYQVYELTSIKVNFVAGKIADIKPGMEVSDFLEKDSQTLDSISVTGSGTTSDAKPTAKPKPKPKPKPTPPPM
jgi:hypothetical protein